MASRLRHVALPRGVRVQCARVYRALHLFRSSVGRGHPGEHQTDVPQGEQIAPRRGSESQRSMLAADLEGIRARLVRHGRAIRPGAPPSYSPLDEPVQLLDLVVTNLLPYAPKLATQPQAHAQPSSRQIVRPRERE